MLADYLVNDLDLIGDLDLGLSQLLLAVPLRAHQKQKAEHCIMDYHVHVTSEVSSSVSSFPETVLLSSLLTFPCHYAECQRD